MSAKSAIPDAWEDDWEAQADVSSLDTSCLFLTYTELETRGNSTNRRPTSRQNLKSRAPSKTS